MADLFDLLWGSGAQSIRRDAEVTLTTDADGKPRLQPERGRIVVLSPDGSIDRLGITHRHFYDGCGCLADTPPGGCCAEPGCGRVSCQHHFSHCYQCLQPCCPRHVETVKMRSGGEIRICRSCYDATRRRWLWRRVLRAVLSPFIEFPDRQ
jgi:hypothetical protein